MLYRFKSRAAADVVMVEAHGALVLQAMGREPSARGIVTVEQLPGVIARLQAAIEADEASAPAAAVQGAPVSSKFEEKGDEKDDGSQRSEPVGLRQRAWPMLDLLQRSLSESADVVWGV